MIKQQPEFLSHWMIMNWMRSELEFDSRLQQKFFSPPECVPGSTPSLGTTQPPELWVRRTRPRGKSDCAFCRWEALKIVKVIQTTATKARITRISSWMWNQWPVSRDTFTRAMKLELLIL